MTKKKTPIKQNRYFLFILLSSVLILGLSLLFISQNYKPTKNSDISHITKLAVYKSDYFNFSFKYPNIFSKFESQLLSDNGSEISYTNLVRSVNETSIIQIGVWNNPNKLNTDKWIGNLRKHGNQSTASYYKPFEYNLVIDGQNAYGQWGDMNSKGQEPGKCNQACPDYEVIVTNDKYAYSISFNSIHEYNPNEFESFKQILIDFKFED
ncbi:MAG: hypothetical protein WA152_02470 [Microgenomates group bacterium]